MNKTFGLSLFINCLLLSCVIGYGFPTQEVAIDCDNTQLVRVLNSVNISFRCIQTSNELLGETTILEESTSKETPHKWYGSVIRRMKIVCPTGTAYNKDKHACLPIKPIMLKILALKREATTPVNEITKEETKERRKCAPGLKYNPITHLCNKPIECEYGTAYNPVTHSCHPTSTSTCRPGTIYNPSIDLCLTHYAPKRPQSDQSFQNDESSVTTEDPVRLTLSPIKPFQVGRMKCREGKVYVSEIDLCLAP